jgi:hypothetical protein
MTQTLPIHLEHISNKVSTPFILNMSVNKMTSLLMEVNLNMLETVLLTSLPENNGEALE